MKIITLVEDSQGKNNLESEHGVSFYIETSQHKVLFDVGQTDLFLRNAIKLGLDLSLVDTVIISHGHYDHGGGLTDFLRINKKAKIYIQRTAFKDYYSMRKENEYTYIGLNKDLDESRFVLLDEDYKIDEELILFNKISNNRFFPKSNQSLFKKVNNEMKLDDFEHEQNLIILTENKVILIAGCAHKGIINIIDQAELILKQRRIDIVLGGFHLSSKNKKYEETKENIEEISKELFNLNVEMFYTGHCTGIIAYDIMKNILKNKLLLIYPGFILNF